MPKGLLAGWLENSLEAVTNVALRVQETPKGARYVERGGRESERVEYVQSVYRLAAAAAS